MGLIDYARGNVLDAYKDENLADNFGERVLQYLRRVPAEQRQNAMAEVHRRRYRIEITHNHGTGMSESMHVATGVTHDEAWTAVLTEQGW